MPATPSSSKHQADDPLYLSVIDLFARVAICYFAIVAVAVVTDRLPGLRYR